MRTKLFFIQLSKMSFWGLVTLVVLTTACQKSEYHRLVISEQDKPRQDSLFLGLYLGMKSKDFFGHCWTLHKEGILANGVNNTTVKYSLDSIYPELTVDFYPAFFEDKIYKMPLIFYFSNYSMWNLNMVPDSLQKYGESVIYSWFGDDFIYSIKNYQGGSDTLKIDVDANRRVIITKAQENKLEVDITDISIDKQAREEIKKSRDNE